MNGYREKKKIQFTTSLIFKQNFNKRKKNRILKEQYHGHHKFIELLIKFLCFSVLQKSCSFVDRISPFACSIPHICFGCLCGCLSRISRYERYKQLIPSALGNLDMERETIYSVVAYNAAARFIDTTFLSCYRKTKCIYRFT